MHELEQFIWFEGHCVTHCPDEQDWPVGHMCPQMPQLLGSVSVLTQAPEHSVSPVWQLVTTHWPLVHVEPEGHLCAQLPQWSGLLAVSTHAPAQIT
jgi:hypothetical protein